MMEGMEVSDNISKPSLLLKGVGVWKCTIGAFAVVNSGLNEFG